MKQQATSTTNSVKASPSVVAESMKKGAAALKKKLTRKEKIPTTAAPRPVAAHTPAIVMQAGDYAVFNDNERRTCIRVRIDEASGLTEFIPMQADCLMVYRLAADDFEARFKPMAYPHGLQHAVELFKKAGEDFGITPVADQYLEAAFTLLNPKRKTTMKTSTAASSGKAGKANPAVAKAAAGKVDLLAQKTAAAAKPAVKKAINASPMSAITKGAAKPAATAKPAAKAAAAPKATGVGSKSKIDLTIKYKVAKNGTKTGASKDYLAIAEKLKTFTHESLTKASEQALRECKTTPMAFFTYFVRNGSFVPAK